MNDLKKLVFDMMKNNPQSARQAEEENSSILHKLYKDEDIYEINGSEEPPAASTATTFTADPDQIEDTEEFVEENLSLADMEREMIIKALEKYRGRRKDAATELGISERTLYRKIKEYNIETA